MRTLLCLSLFLASFALRAQQDGFGLGIIIGEPTGVSFKKFINDKRAIDGAVAWSFRHHDGPHDHRDNGWFHLHADHLWHSYNVINVNKGRLPLYYGVGVRLSTPSNDLNLGIRIPVGLAYMFDSAPVDIFLEVVPILDLVPDSDVDFNAALGARFYF